MPGSTPEPATSRRPGTRPDCRERYDVAVLGAGPAGLAGAVHAAELGLCVALLDSSGQPGGQYYRHPPPAARAARPEALHHDWQVFADLRDRLASSGATQLFGHDVWTITRAAEDDWTVHALADENDPNCPTEQGRRPVTVRARAILLATGSYERHLPFPGWTLPGVVGAGGAQAMLKSGLVLPGRRVVVAGSGPLLLAVAASLTSAGAQVPELIEASGYLGYARRPDVLAAQTGKLTEAVRHGAALLRHGVRLRTRHAVTEAHGTDRVEAVTVTRLDRDWRPVPGTDRRIACDALAVGHSLIPQIDLATALGCATRRTADGTHALELGPLQETSLRGMWSAGETSGVGGAQLAVAEGTLAGLAIAARLTGRLPATASRPRARSDMRALRALRSLRRSRDRMRAFADVMAAAHAPGPGWPGWLSDDTDVCRCEEVSAGRVREAVREYGARDARTVKLLTRAGMGWCQGRMCGSAVACLVASATPRTEAFTSAPTSDDPLPAEAEAEARGEAEAEAGDAPAPAPAPDRRLLATPVPLATLAALPETPGAPPQDPSPHETPYEAPYEAPHATYTPAPYDPPTPTSPPHPTEGQPS
ncbi:NAD(P)/FAD-dependent oxidoreductase [Streptomyces sp. NPDC048518]|uniref:FAD/NAD(P)-dependent oxidoreductase n=1 Tax=Streptomyces sp. NPDC048518 TaxID=3155029 RepID=UPI0033FF3FC2